MILNWQLVVLGWFNCVVHNKQGLIGAGEPCESTIYAYVIINLPLHLFPYNIVIFMGTIQTTACNRNKGALDCFLDQITFKTCMRLEFCSETIYFRSYFRTKYLLRKLDKTILLHQSFLTWNKRRSGISSLMVRYYKSTLLRFIG